jgi:hypothetical protein
VVVLGMIMDYSNRNIKKINNLFDIDVSLLSQNPFKEEIINLIEQIILYGKLKGYTNFSFHNFTTDMFYTEYFRCSHGGKDGLDISFVKSSTKPIPICMEISFSNENKNIVKKTEKEEDFLSGLSDVFLFF